jgi:hypothetical protein
MSDYTITIPEALYNEARNIAEETERSVDEVIRTQLELSLAQSRLNLPEDEQEELKALAHLSDDTLWTIAREQMPRQKQEQMQALMQNNSSGTISVEELSQLEYLVEQGQRLTLRKAEAMRLLMQRGFSINLDNLAPAND